VCALRRRDIPEETFSRFLPFLPDGTRIYAVGDVHGRADLLNAVCRAIDDDVAARPVVRPVGVFLGDYIDRGPQSREAVESLMLRSRARECVFLRGNHEATAMKCLTDATAFDNWMRRLGGMETLLSYGLERKTLGSADVIRLQSAFLDHLPDTHLRFFGSLQSQFSCGSFFFAHAGIRPGLSLDRQNERDLLWIRDEFLSSTDQHGKVIVHGHTPVEKPDVRSNRINIDTGAFATDSLTCLVIDPDRLSTFSTA
jgi:serine/threonine protein phosphatase 1